MTNMEWKTEFEKAVFGRDAALAEAKRLRKQVTQLETELAMTSNALRVTQDSVLRNVDRADAAEAEAAKWRELHDDRNHDLAHEYARSNAAEAEAARLRAELAVAQDLLRDVPEHSANWYADICDYLETLDYSGQDAAGG